MVVVLLMGVNVVLIVLAVGYIVELFRDGVGLR